MELQYIIAILLVFLIFFRFRYNKFMVFQRFFQLRPLYLYIQFLLLVFLLNFVLFYLRARAFLLLLANQHRNENFYI